MSDADTIREAQIRAAFDQIDWYRRCLEDLQDRKPVRGLAEAKAGYDAGMLTLAAALDRLVAGSAPDPRDAVAGLMLDGSRPVEFRVQEFTPEGHATRLFGVVADYDWAQQILFADAYEWAARAICDVLAAALGSPVETLADQLAEADADLKAGRAVRLPGSPVEPTAQQRVVEEARKFVDLDYGYLPDPAREGIQRLVDALDALDALPVVPSVDAPDKETT